MGQVLESGRSSSDNNSSEDEAYDMVKYQKQVDNAFTLSEVQRLYECEWSFKIGLFTFITTSVASIISFWLYG